MEAKKPLSLMEKITTGFKGFVKTAISYLPRGLLFVPIGFAISTGVHALTGIDFLGVNNAMSQGPGALLTLGLRSLAIGMTISGGFGAYNEVSDSSAKRAREIESQQAGQSRGQSQVPQKKIEHNVVPPPQANLTPSFPQAVPPTKPVSVSR